MHLKENSKFNPNSNLAVEAATQSILRIDGLTAVNHQCMASDERSFVRNEKQHSIGDLFRPTHAQQRFVAIAHHFPLFVSHSFAECWPWRKTSEAWCFDGAGANAVDADAERAVVHRHLAREIDDRRLSRAIARVIR